MAEHQATPHNDTHPHAHTHGEHAHDPHAVVEGGVHHVHSSTREIWRVFFILLAITVLEFAIAFADPVKEAIGVTGVAIVFLALTVLKAFYIVSYFMHLKHEKVNMAYTILVPLLFIVYLIVLLIFEGAATNAVQ